MSSAALLLAYITLQRLSELFIAKRHTAALLARGGQETGANHYPVMVTMHATWLVTLWLFAWNHSINAAFLVPVALLQIGRFWVLRTLGERWTTRVIILPGATPIVSGPFRFVRHPNYLIVAFELPLISLAVGLGWHALVFGALNLAMLAWRIRSEDAAFAGAAATRH